MKHKKIAIAGFTASMLLGAGTGLVLNIPGGASAADTAVTATPTDPTDTTDSTDSTDSTDETTSDAPRPNREEGLAAALAELVTAGTITQDQADAVAASITTAHDGPGRGQGGPGGHSGPGRPGGRGGSGGGMIADAAATALGISPDELKTELDAGRTIAEVAADTGIDVQTVIDAIVADRTADLTERVTDLVNGVAPTPPAAPAD